MPGFWGAISISLTPCEVSKDDTIIGYRELETCCLAYALNSEDTVVLAHHQIGDPREWSYLLIQPTASLRTLTDPSYLRDTAD